jgi:hypothetical protein
MNILKEIMLIDLFLYVPKYKLFIISDVHLGYEEALNKRGIFVPKNTYDDLILRLERSLEQIKKTYIIDKIVINGDLIHEFGKVSVKEKILIRDFLKFLSNYGKVILLEGNHDKALKYFIGNNFTIQNHFISGNLLIIHGDVLLKKEALKNIKTLVIGHEHPAINVKSFLKVEKFKCFLKGKYLDKNLIVMPSCNLLIEGTDILGEKLLSPYLNAVTLNNFETYIIGDEIYDFGKLKNFMK